MHWTELSCKRQHLGLDCHAALDVVGHRRQHEPGLVALKSQVTRLGDPIMLFEDAEHALDGAADARPLAVLVLLPAAQRLVAPGLVQDAVAGVALGQELVMYGAGVSLVGIHLFLGGGQQFFQGLGVMFVARGIVDGLDEAVLIDVDVRLVAVSAGLLAVGRDLDAVAPPRCLGCSRRWHSCAGGSVWPQ